MKKSQELKNHLATVMNNVETLRANNQLDEVRAKLDEARLLRDEIRIQEEIEEEEKNNFNGQEFKDDAATPNALAAFNKAVLKRPMNEAEIGLVEKDKEHGGYLVPEEQLSEIERLKRDNHPLKQYFRVIKVNSLSGTMPLEVTENDELTDFDELTQMSPSTITFGNVTWKCTTKGDLIPVSNILLQDTNVNVLDFIKERFAKKSVRSENKSLLAALQKAEKVTGTDYETIIDVTDEKLDPALAQNAIIITDQKGFRYLSGLRDADDKKLLVKDPVTKDYIFNESCKVVRVATKNFIEDNGKLNFFVGDMYAYATFFDRAVYDVAMSTEAGFTQNATLMRILERYDVQVVDREAVRHVEITPAGKATKTSGKTA